MILIFFFFISSLSFRTFDYIAVYSSDSDSNLLQLIEKKLNIHSKFDISNESIHILENYLKITSNPIFLDLTENPQFYPILDQVAQAYSTIYLTLNQPNEFENSQFRFFVRSTQNYELNCIKEMITFLSWKKFSIFFEAEFHKLRIASSLKSDFSDQLKYFVSLVNEISDDSLNMIVKKTIKASETRKILIIGEGSVITKLQYFIHKRKIEIPGTHFLFSPEGIYSAYLNGSIILAYPGTEKSKNSNEFKANLFNNILDNLIEKDARSYLNEKCPKNICVQVLNIFNIQSDTKIFVGNFTNKINFSNSIIYPGETTSKLASLTSIPLGLSISNGTFEPIINATNKLFSNIYKGAEYGVYRSNLFNEIPNFHIELIPTNCGNEYYDPSFSLSCFSKLKSNLGIAHLSSICSVGTLGNYKTFSTLNLTLPQITHLSLIEDLNNKTKYPNLIKLGMTNYDYGENLLLFLLSFKWSSVIFFGSTHKSYYKQCLEYLNIIHSIGAKVINPENLRFFPENMQRSELEKFKDYFLFAKSTKCRVYFFMTPFSAFLLEGLYDVGLRKEDVIVFTGISMYNSISEVVESRYREKRLEFISGILVFTYKEWVGELGKQLFDEISMKVTSETTYLCMTYDSISVFKHSINHLLMLYNLGKIMMIQKYLSNL